MPKKSKPEWDESIPGRSPAMMPILTEAEKALLALKHSLGASMMSDDEKWLAARLQDAEGYVTNLNQFSDLSIPTDDREQKIAACRVEAVRALRDTGRFNEALAIADSDEAAEVERYRDAVLADDAADCGCPRETASIEDPRRKGQEVTIDLNRRYKYARVYSGKHKAVVYLWRCRHCGDLNAHPDPPERQMGLIALRSEAKNLHRQIGYQPMSQEVQGEMLKRSVSDTDLLR